MNIYFLTEDSKSFRKVLPTWLRYVLPNISEIKTIHDFRRNGNQYMTQDGGGYPCIMDRVDETIQTFVENHVPLDYFIVCWDRDARSDAEIQADINAFQTTFERYQLPFHYKLIIMEQCFETWLLGNRSAYPLANVLKSFVPFAQFYNVALNDPEKMMRPMDWTQTVSRYHGRYLQEMLRSSFHTNYSKGNPGVAMEAGYWKELCLRVEQTEDLRSFVEFLHFLQELQRDSQTLSGSL